MEIINNVVISFWFDELAFHPKDKINELQEEIKSIIDTPLLYNEEGINHYISMPRIQGISTSQDVSFVMSLINCHLTINVSNKDIDEVILLLNNDIQYLYDILVEIYGLQIRYTSLKVQIVEELNDAAMVLANRFGIDKKIEDFSIRRGYIKNDYYINILSSSSKEYNYNIERKEQYIEQDSFDKTMITSLQNAHKNKEFINEIIEINDRNAFNKDANYLSKKDIIRGMIIELKDILKTKEYCK